MGDGSSSSSSGGSGSGGRGRRGGGGEGETVVIDHGRRRSSCGYCGSSSLTSISHGLWAHSITVDDYQELLDRGWRRSGCFLYKPEMESTCCPSYTIRLKASDFVPSKEQLRVHKKLQRFLDGTIFVKKPDQFKDKQNSSRGSFDMADHSFSTSDTASAAKESSVGICGKKYHEDEVINYLSKKIEEAVSASVGSGEIPSIVQLPKAVVKKVNTQLKRKLVGMPEDLLYTSNISFQIAAAFRRLCSGVENVAPIDTTNGRREGDPLEISPNSVAEKLAYSLAQNGDLSGLIIKACNGHLNFYCATKQIGSMPITTDSSMQTSKSNTDEFPQSCTNQDSEMPCKRRKLEIRMKRSSFDPEEFALYRKYQIEVHDDKPEKVTESSYKRFLVDTPLVFVPPRMGYRTVPPCGYGSFHQQYLIDGKLVAVGVVDILPRCLSSKYLFWDPDLAFLSLGKYSALQEINWVKESEIHCPSLQYYYLGYYIHSCIKMRYKAAYRPSELLCPVLYKWVPFDNARPLLDKKKYVILSECMDLECQASSRQLPSSSMGKSLSPADNEDLNKAFGDREAGTNPDHEDSDTDVDNKLGAETSSANDLTDADIGNIVLDLNGPRVKFKDLQQMFGPIKRSHINELETQLRRYAKVVGKELSKRVVYSLG